MTETKWFTPKKQIGNKTTYILPLGKNSYSFCAADNKVDAWGIFQNQNPRSQLAGMSYNDVMTAKEYFKKSPKTYYSKQLKRHVTIPED